MRLNYRWIVVGLLFTAITFNYVDRTIFTLVAPVIAYSFGWTKSIEAYSSTPYAVQTIALILFIWGLAYTLMNFPGGWIVDKLGIRKSMGVLFAVWSAFTVLTAFTFNFLSMVVVRIFMGAGEGPVWTVNAKTAKNWASLKDYSKSFAFAGTGQAVGPVIGLFIGTVLYELFGWRGPFIFFGALGLVMALVWYFFVRDTPSQHPRVSKDELHYIKEGKGEVNEEKPLPSKKAWAMAARVIFGTQAGWGVMITFLTFAFVLGTFLTWLPLLMFATFAHSVTKSGLYSTVADLGLIVGYALAGPFNDGLLRKFDKVNARRIGALLPMSLMILFVGLSYFTGTARLLVPTVGLLAAAAAVMNLSVGSWAVNAIDIAPMGTSAITYGVYNGFLNLVGSFTSLIQGYLFTHYPAPLAFSTMMIPIALFLAGYLALIRHDSWERAISLGRTLSAKAFATSR